MATTCKQGKSPKTKNKSFQQKLSHNDNIPSCLRGDDSFNIEEWLLSCSVEDTDKLSSQIIPTRAAAIKAKNGLSNKSRLKSLGRYDYDQYRITKDRDPRQVINENRIFYEEYIEPFKCIQLFNQATLELLAYKTTYN